MSTKNKKKIFSLGIYVEGLRRLRLVGIISTVLLALAAIMIPVSTVVANIGRETILKRSVTGFSLHPVLIVSFIIIAPVLTWITFSFLNKRNSSDFYHALPHTRVSMFLSSVAAVITWIAFIILSTSGIAALSTVIFSRHINLVSGTMIPYIIGCFAASVLVISAVAMALTVTGRPFSNFAVAMMVLFFPRFIVFMVTYAVSTKLPIASASLFGALNFENLNLIFSMVFSVFGLNSLSFEALLTGTASQVYTLVLGVIYLAVSCLLFRIRKSEAAEHAAPNRTLQAVYRIVACMVVSSVVTSLWYAEGTDGNLFAIVGGYIIAVIVYFLYEIITTRKVKNIIRAVPGLAVVVLLNGVMAASMVGIYNSEAGFAPSAQEIDSISVSRQTYDYYDYRMDFGEYVNMLSNDIKITDKDAITAVADALSDNVKNLNATDIYKYYNHYDSKQTQYYAFDFKIKSGMQNKERRIFITEEQKNIIVKALENSKEYSNACQTVPEAEPGTVYCPECDLFSDDAVKNIYDTLKKEVREIPFDVWYDRISSYSGENSIDSVNFTTVYGGKIYRMYVPIYQDIMPKTTEAYINSLGSIGEMYLKDFSQMDPKNVGVFNIGANIWDDEKGCYTSASYVDNGLNSSYGYGSTFLGKLPTITESGTIRYGDSYVSVFVETFDGKGNYDGQTYIVKLSEESREVWEPLFKAYNDEMDDPEIIVE